MPFLVSCYLFLLINSSLNILPADPADAEKLTAIAFAAKRHWGYPEEWIQGWAVDLTYTPDFIASHIVMKAVIDDEIVGVGMWTELPAGNYELEGLWVLPDSIGQGIGRRLLSTLLADVTPDRYPIKIVADPYAVGFYEKMGAVHVGEIPSTPEGRFLPVMELPLPIPL